MKRIILSLTLVTALMAVLVTPALAEETVTGSIQTIDELGGTFTILTLEGATLQITAPEGFNWTTSAIGSTVSATGDFAEDGSFTATALTVTPAEEDGDAEEQVNNGFFCSNPSFTHPVLGSVADTFSVDYATVLEWFCGGGLGVGGVAQALAASQASGASPDEVLALRAEMGWGQVWKTLAANEDSEGEDDSIDPAELPGPGNGNGNGNALGHGHGTGQGQGNGNGNGHNKNH